jgi:hypothetical protein
LIYINFNLAYCKHWTGLGLDWTLDCTLDLNVSFYCTFSHKSPETTKRSSIGPIQQLTSCLQDLYACQSRSQSMPVRGSCHVSLYACQFRSQSVPVRRLRWVVRMPISFPEYACSRVMPVCHYLTREQAYSGNETISFPEYACSRVM